MKVCSKCKVEKDESEFGKERKAKSGLKSRCKKCMSKYDSEYGKKNKEKIDCYNRAWRKNNNEKSKAMILRSREKWSKEMSDGYVKRLIFRDCPNKHLIPQDLVDFHREVIRAKRLLKELQK